MTEAHSEKFEEEQLIVSRQRVTDHGEVYTPKAIVNQMLDLVAQETERIDSRFLLNAPTIQSQTKIALSIFSKMRKMNIFLWICLFGCVKVSLTR